MIVDELDLNIFSCSRSFGPIPVSFKAPIREDQTKLGHIRILVSGLETIIPIPWLESDPSQ